MRGKVGDFWKYKSMLLRTSLHGVQREYVRMLEFITFFFGF